MPSPTAPQTRREEDVVGPYILWLDYGMYEGWAAYSFSSIDEAFAAPRFDRPWIITKRVVYKMEEIDA